MPITGHDGESTATPTCIVVKLDVSYLSKP
jgi:hypothetical protein